MSIKKDGLLIALYVDNVLIVGRRQVIDDFVLKFGRDFNIRVDLQVKDFVGVELDWIKEGTLKIHQQKLTSKLLDKWKQEIKG